MDRTTERQTYTEQIEQRIKATLREFQEMELEQMRKGEIEARARLARVKSGVDEKRTVAQRKLHRARKATADAWVEAKAEVEDAWRELRDEVDHARQELSDGEKEKG